MKNIFLYYAICGLLLHTLVGRLGVDKPLFVVARLDEIIEIAMVSQIELPMCIGVLPIYNQNRQ